MEAFLILFGTGVFLVITGMLVLKREKRLFKDQQYTKAKVVTYYQYEDTSNRIITMYTMAVEYTLLDGTLMHAREQSGSTHRKYPVGTEIEIRYSHEKPELFIVQGDHSRKMVLIGMIVVGLMLMGLAITILGGVL